MSNIEQTEATEEASGLRTALDAANQTASEATTESAKLALKMTVYETGVPMTPVGRLFAESYSGADDADSIQAAWQALGIGSEPAGETPQVHQPTEAELAMAGQVAGGMSPEVQPGVLTADQQRVTKILEFRESGDQEGLVSFLQAEGMTYDPEDGIELGNVGWLGVDAARPAGVSVEPPK